MYASQIHSTCYVKEHHASAVTLEENETFRGTISKLLPHVHEKTNMGFENSVLRPGQLQLIDSCPQTTNRLKKGRELVVYRQLLAEYLGQRTVCKELLYRR